MFKKLARLFSEEKPAKKTGAKKKAALKKPTEANKKIKPSKDNIDESPKALIQQAILEAEKTLAMEERIAGHDKDHLEVVQGAMMIYRQKQESLDALPLKEKAQLRAMGEVMFGTQLSKAEKKAKKTH